MFRRKKMSKCVVIKNGCEFFDVGNFPYIIIEWFKNAIIDVITTIYKKLKLFSNLKKTLFTKVVFF